MRRLAAVVLLCVFGAMLPLATVFAVAAPQQLLPICCRAHGAHACVMGSAGVSSDTAPTLRQMACPLGRELRAIATIISSGFGHSVSFGLATNGLTWAFLALMVAARFLHRSSPRGPPVFLF
jgi:hypothetical protein